MIEERCKPLAAMALAAGLSAAVGTANAAESWDFASPYPGFNFHGRNHQMFIDEVRERTDGGIDITLHAGASLFALPEIRRAVQTRQIAIGEQLMSTLENQDPVFGVDAIPFLANGQELARILWYASRPTIEAKLDEMGLTLLYAVSWPGQGLFSEGSISSVDDLANTKLRIQNPSTAKLADMLGAVPVRVESADIPQAMTTGIIEAFITSASTSYDKKAWDYIDFYYDLNAYQPKNAVYINTAIFENIEPEWQEILMDAAAKAEARGWFMMTTEYEAKRAAFCELVECAIPPSPELMAEFEAIGKRMTDAWIEESGPEAQAIVDEYTAMREAGAVELTE